MPSTSAPTLRNRVPLAPLPLSLFVHPANSLPSPISLPLKRNAPSSSSTSTTTSTADGSIYSSSRGKLRKVSVEEIDVQETVKRTRVKEVTPKAKSILERDELGTGRSPARRLFADASPGTSLGIIGAVPLPSSPQSIPNRSLAPSPPISDREEYRSPGVLPMPLDINIDIHHVDFAIYSDSITASSTYIRTPESRRTASTFNPPLAPDAEAHIPSSPASSSRSYGSMYDENQENIPPPLSPSRSYSTQSSPSSSRHKRHLDDDNDCYGSGSRARRLERSKLGLVESVYDNEEDEDELTPGRIMRKDVGKGKAKLTMEVNRI